MTDDRIVRLLGDHVALTSVEATTWRRVTTGELTPDEAADLLGSSDEERERARRIFGPPTPAQRQEQREALLARLAREERPSAVPAEVATVVALPPAVREVPRWKRWAAVAFSAAAVSTAAAVLLTSMPTSPTSTPAPFVAGYRADPLVGIEAQRGSPTTQDTASYLPRGKLKLVLRPEHDVEQDIGVVGFARGPSGVVRLRLTPKVESNGLVVIDTTPLQLGLTTGEHELVLAVGPRQALPTSWEELERAEPRGYDTVWVEQKIHVLIPTEPSVRYAGCVDVWLEPKPRCVFDPARELSLWLDDADPSQIAVRLDGKPWAHEALLVEELSGVRLRGKLPAEAERLELTIEGLAPWSLFLVAKERAADPPSGTSTSTDVDLALAEAFQAAMGGRHQEALDLLDAVEANAARYPRGIAMHATYRGIVLWRQGRFYDAAGSLREGVVFALELGDQELEGDSLPMYAVVLAELGYLDAAIHWATAFHASLQRFPCEARGPLLSTLGWIHLVSALQDGRPLTTARALLDEGSSLVSPGGECPEPTAVPGLSLSLALVDLHEGRAADARARLLGIDESQATRDQLLRIRDAHVQTLLALGDPVAAANALAQLVEAVTYDDTPEGRWRLALREGDLFALQGRAEQAVAAYRRAEQHSLEIIKLAAAGVGRETAALLHAQSTEGLVSQLVALGRPEAALCAAREAQARRIQAVGGTSDDPTAREAIARAGAAYAEARWAVDEELRKRERSSRKERERLLAAAARSEQALAEAADALLAQRSTWRPTCEELVPRRPTELLLGLYPFQRGWMVLVQDDQGTDARWIAGGPTHALTDPRLGQELLDPLGERLAAAKVVRVLASEWAQDIDVHLLEWNSVPLVEHVPVVYGAELPQRTEAPEDPHRAKRALLVQDPTETLLAPEAEVAVIRSELERLGWEIDAPPAALADRQDLRDGLLQAGFFYYAGHAEHDVDRSQSLSLPPYAGGTRAWPARLRLVPPTTFEIQDILALDSVPAKIALIGCQTGVPGRVGGGMSLALAFLVAGAEEVVATPEVTADAIGSATGEGLVAGISRDGVSLVDGLQRAQRGLLQRHEPVGRYRVWVR